MGYLDNSSVTVDAILTLKGRELLAKGGSEFNITQFALGDDEVDYNLWNPSNPAGSDHFGDVIENMPILEAIPDESQALRYKLITLAKGSYAIPVVTVTQTSIILTTAGQTNTIIPNTNNGGNRSLGYTAILSDTSVCGIQASSPLTSKFIPTVPRYLGDSADATTQAVAGFEFTIIAKAQPVATKTATITIIANETGGSTTINVTVNKM